MELVTSQLLPRKLLILIIGCLLLFLSACSASLAFSGTNEPNFKQIQPGADRDLVEKELGLPVKEQDQKVLYTYKAGDRSAPLRGTMHLILDICTIFLWEYIGLPIEVANSGYAQDVEVYYNEEDKLVNYHLIPRSNE